MRKQFKLTKLTNHSNLEGSSQFLDTIEESVALSDSLVEKFLLAIRAVALNDALDLVNFAVNLAVVNEIAEFAVEEVLGDPESSRHVFDGH
jgi:hypothetical protein